MEEDLSKKTIVVLVILTVIISVLGTFVVVSEVNALKAPSGAMTKAPAVGKPSNIAVGQVGINIVPAPMKDESTGKVTLTILPK
jgi:hypothetical protein